MTAGRVGCSTRTRVWVGVVAAVLTLVVVRPVFGAVGGSGDYTFLRENGGEPVTWNHCRAIPFEVNPKGAPAHWQQIDDAR